MKVEYLTNADILRKETYVSFDGGHINFHPSKEKRGDIQFKWTPLFSMKKGLVQNEPVKNVRYRLAYTNNPNVNLDSICAIKRRSDVKFIDV